MPYALSEWLNLALRWLHIFVGILWIGQTWFFMWLDARLHMASERGQVWMVHSGGFYVVERKAAPDFGRALHWWKWEAALAWLSGMGLLALVYWGGGAMAGASVGVDAAVGIGVGTLAGGWIVYDALWLSPLARAPRVAAAVCYALLVGVAFFLARVMPGRAAYMHVGAMLGTIMVLNVWVRIIPAQRRMVEAAKAGGVPDPLLGERAKDRSKHNTFMVLPVVFVMISNHFPVATYGHEHNWAVLGALVL
ncbi:MAG: urate hydroxylase PuuD, partial [Myxococcota bacterium]